jgi:hypothetical protein
MLGHRRFKFSMERIYADSRDFIKSAVPKPLTEELVVE